MFISSKLAILALLTSQFSSLSNSSPILEQRAPPLNLGLAASFGAIAGTTLTSTGASVITGNCGTYPGSAVVGFSTGNQGKCTGSINAANTAAQNAEAALLTTYNNGQGLVPTKILAYSDLGGLTLAPGVYTFPTVGAVLSTTLTLNGTSNSNGQFVFQVKTTFMTSVGTSKIVLVGGAKACNVYIFSGSSVTVGAGSQLQANILAYTSIAVNAAASVNGTLGALHGAVTLNNDKVTAQPMCAS